MIGYFIGRRVSEVISVDRTEKLKKYQQYLLDHPKIAPFLIYLFGLTPLNDDIIIIPLGIIKYDVRKTIFWIWLGKFGLMLSFAYNLLNVCTLLGGENWILSILTLYFTIIIVYLMVKVDFIKIFQKLKRFFM